MNSASTERIRGFVNGTCTFEVSDDGPLDGETVILLHGFPQSAKSWAGVCTRLHERGYRTITFDQRGYGAKARPRGRMAYRLSELTADVVALVDALGKERVHLVGHDWGAAVAWSTAARFPSRIGTLTAVSVPHPRAFLRSMLSSSQALRSYYFASFQIPGLTEHFLRRYPKRATGYMRIYGMSHEQIRHVRGELLESGAVTGGLHWYRAMPFIRPSDLPKVERPTTFVWSTRDIAVSRRAAELCERYVTGPYKLEVLEGSHWIPEEEPDRLSEIIAHRIVDARHAS